MVTHGYLKTLMLYQLDTGLVPETTMMQQNNYHHLAKANVNNNIPCGEIEILYCSSINPPLQLFSYNSCQWFTVLCHWLTDWGWVTHIFVSKLTTIGSDNGLLPGRRQAIIWTNAWILLIQTLGTNFSDEILREIYTFSFKKMHLKMSSGKCRPSCLGLNVLTLDVPLISYGKIEVHLHWLR